MARIRSIHPGLFTDEAFMSLSSDAQVFLIGLWTEADDQGVFEWKPMTLRVRLRPARDGDVDSLLAEISAVNAIMQFESGGKTYGAIRNFRKYQRPKSPSAVHPLPDDFRIYVGLTPSISETTRVKQPPFPQKGEMSPQMEEGGDNRRRKEEEGKKEDATPNGAHSVPTEEAELFRRGKAVLGKSAGGMIADLLKAKDGRVALARAAIEQASTKHSPREYIGRVIRDGTQASLGASGELWDPGL